MSKTIQLRAFAGGRRRDQESRAPDHDLTLIIPAYNEEGRLPVTLGKVRDWMVDWGLDYRVIVADDGSRDATPTMTDRFGSRFSTLTLIRNQGKGAAVRSAMLAATGRIVAFTDADLPYDLESLKQGYELIRADSCDVVFGARDLETSRVIAPRRFSRRLASTVFQYVARALISRDVVDTQAGLKLFESSAAHAIFARTTIDGFAFDAEVVFLTHRLNLRHHRVPVTLVNEESSSVSVWRHSLPMLLEIGRIRWRALRGVYEPAVERPVPTTVADDAATGSRKAAA